MKIKNRAHGYNADLCLHNRESLKQPPAQYSHPPWMYALRLNEKGYGKASSSGVDEDHEGSGINASGSGSFLGSTCGAQNDHCLERRNHVVAVAVDRLGAPVACFGGLGVHCEREYDFPKESSAWSNH
jgi:hypothetical protein